MRGVLLLLCLLIAVYGQKLSEAENLARFQSCGKYSNETARTVPWVIKTYYSFPTTNGFAISSRHIVTHSETSMFQNNEGQIHWKYHGLVDWSKCKNGVMPIDTDILESFKIFSCGPISRCQNDGISGYVTRGVYMGSCNGKKEPFGLMVLELDRDFAKNESVTPVCLDEDVTAEIGDKLELHVHNYDTKLVERQENIMVDCGDRELPDSAVCIKNDKCFWYPGGAFVKNIGGRMTAVAVSHNYGCKMNDTVFIQLSIKKFLPAICEFTGVCQPPPPPTTTPSPPPPPITDKINEENDQKTEEQTDENTGSASSENSSTGTQTLELFSVLALFCYLY